MNRKTRISPKKPKGFTILESLIILFILLILSWLIIALVKHRFRPDGGIKNPAMPGIEQPETGVVQPEPVVEQPETGVVQPEPIIEQPETNVFQLEDVVEDPELPKLRLPE